MSTHVHDEARYGTGSSDVGSRRTNPACTRREARSPTESTTNRGSRVSASLVTRISIGRSAGAWLLEGPPLHPPSAKIKIAPFFQGKRALLLPA